MGMPTNCFSSSCSTTLQICASIQTEELWSCKPCSCTSTLTQCRVLYFSLRQRVVQVKVAARAQLDRRSASSFHSPKRLSPHTRSTLPRTRE
eukprot:1378300-Rhodomonas_salina.1